MTMTSRPTTVPGSPLPDRLSRNVLPAVVVDLYRDIHKGIRAELFAVTGLAGSVDPSAREERVQVADRVRDLSALLVEHAEHEDAAVQPALELHLPALAEQIAVDHITIDARLLTLQDLAMTAAEATGAEQRGRVHAVYLELASFTSAYLEHQDVEEREVMPRLEAIVGPEETAALHHAIVSNIPPEEMARSLAIMVPAMNIDDRAELLGGMQAGAPAEVFAGIWGLVGSLLAPREVAALGARLGID